jgi:hypothetical protein
MRRRQRPLVTRVHRLQHVQGLTAPYPAAAVRSIAHAPLSADVVIRAREFLPGGKWRWVTILRIVPEQPEEQPPPPSPRSVGRPGSHVRTQGPRARPTVAALLLEEGERVFHLSPPALEGTRVRPYRSKFVPIAKGPPARQDAIPEQAFVPSSVLRRAKRSRWSGCPTRVI